jgi:dolichyl-phosphate beta-glucosyltransferase
MSARRIVDHRDCRPGAQEEAVIKLCVVIPAFNEAVRLPPTLRSIAEYLGGHPEWKPAEIVVVDDGSTDGTAEAVRPIPMPDGVELLIDVHDRNRGKGAAIRTAFTRSRADWLLLCDADLATPVEEIEVVGRVADDDCVVVGSRAIDRRLIEVRQPGYRDFMGRVFNLVVQALLLPGITDTQCGFKMFPGNHGRALAEVQTIDGFAFDVELLLLASQWGYRLREVPVRWRHVDASRVQAVRHSGQMMRDLLGLSARRISHRLPSAPPGLRARGSDIR